MSTTAVFCNAIAYLRLFICDCLFAIVYLRLFVYIRSLYQQFGAACCAIHACMETAAAAPAFSERTEPNCEI